MVNFYTMLGSLVLFKILILVYKIIHYVLDVFSGKSNYNKIYYNIFTNKMNSQM
jgi:hypothetical protein